MGIREPTHPLTSLPYVVVERHGKQEPKKKVFHIASPCVALCGPELDVRVHIISGHNPCLPAQTLSINSRQPVKQVFGRPTAS